MICGDNHEETLTIERQPMSCANRTEDEIHPVRVMGCMPVHGAGNAD